MPAPGACTPQSVARARMPPRNIRKKRRDSDDEERDGVEDDESTAEALERARAAQAARSRAKGLHVETLISGKRAEHVKPADADLSLIHI